MDFGAISRDFGRKISRPRKKLQNFRSEIRRKSHGISRSAARRLSAQCVGTFPLLDKAARRQLAWILARSHAISDEKFRGREKVAKFSVRNPSHIPRASACRRSAQCLGTSATRGKTVHRRSAGISARSPAISDKKFRDREKNCKIFGPRSAANRTESHVRQHADSPHSACGPLRFSTRL